VLTQAKKGQRGDQLIEVDWTALATQLGALEYGPKGERREHGGDGIARQALNAILGDEFWREAVDSWLAGTPGSEVIRSIIWLLNPPAAAARCYEIYKSNADQETRQYAVILLKDAADGTVLPWVAELLNDPEEDINVISIWFLDKLLFDYRYAAQWSRDEFAQLLGRAEAHPSQRVREQLAGLQVRERFDDPEWAP
jgi:hypothetical protein